MAQPPLDESVIRETYDAVAQTGSVEQAAMRLKLPRTTIQNRYQAALRLGWPELRPAKQPPAAAPAPTPEPPREPLNLPFEEAWQNWMRAVGMAKDRYTGESGTRRDKYQGESGTRKILVVPDLHAPFHEAEMFAAMLEREADADHVICIGDLGDAYSLSSFVHYERMPYRDEWASVNLCMQELASRFPKVTVVIGNHDARLEKRLRERLTEDMVDALQMITGGVLCPITAMAKRYPNVEIARHTTPDGMTLDWCVEVGDAWLGHPEKYSKVSGAALRALEDWLADFQQQYGFQQHRLIVMGHTHAYAQIPFRGNKLLVECGALCKTQGYMTSPRIGGRPQRRGYLVFHQDPSGRTDLNSVRFHWFDVAERVA